MARLTTSLLIVLVVLVGIVTTAVVAECPVSTDMTTAEPYSICSSTLGDTDLQALLDSFSAYDDLNCDTYKPCDKTCPVTLVERCIAWDETTTKFVITPCTTPRTDWELDTSVSPTTLVPTHCVEYFIIGIADKLSEDITGLNAVGAEKCLDGDFPISALCTTSSESYSYDSTDARPTECPDLNLSTQTATASPAASCVIYGCGASPTVLPATPTFANLECTATSCQDESTRHLFCAAYSYTAIDKMDAKEATFALESDLTPCNTLDPVVECFDSFCTETEADLTATITDTSTVGACEAQIINQDEAYCQTLSSACQVSSAVYAGCYSYDALTQDWTLSTKDKCTDLDPMTETTTTTNIYTIDTPDCSDATLCIQYVFYATDTTPVAHDAVGSIPLKTLADLTISVWADLKAATAQVDPTNITCTGYTFSYYTANAALIADDTETTLTFITIDAAQEEVVDDLDNQCVDLCKYSESTEAEACRTEITQCQACTEAAQFELSCGTTIAPTVTGEDCPGTASNICTCSIFCDAKVDDDDLTLTLHDEITSSTAISCVTDSFRPSSSYCFGDDIASTTVRDVYCVFTESGKHYYADDNCDGVSTLTAVEFVPDDTNCTYEYLCGDSEMDLQPCVCPSTSPAQGQSACDTAGLVVSPVIQCAVTWDDSSNDAVEFNASSPAQCCEKASDPLGTTSGSDCGCGCLEYEWQCLCQPKGFNDSTELVICDCQEPDVSDAALCFDGLTEADNSACTILPVTVRCVKNGAAATDTAVADEKCETIDVKPTIVSYTCPPNTAFPLGSTKCPTKDTTCYNSNQTATDAYDCTTCVDASGAATSRSVICSYTYTDLTTATDGTSVVVATCPSATATEYGTCVTSPTTTSLTVTRGDEVSYTWSYIGPTPSTQSFTFQPRDWVTTQGFTMTSDHASTTTLYSTRTFSYTPSTTLTVPFSTILNTVVDSEVQLNADDEIEVEGCAPSDQTCIAQLCTLQGTTCQNGGSCVLDEATTFTKCSCPTGSTGPQCQYSSTCTSADVCFQNGFPQFSGECKKCTCNDQFTGDRCQTCSADSINQFCTANRFVPSTSSKSCSCQCFYGYAGATCATRVFYATLQINVPPESTFTASTSWERLYDTSALTQSQSTFVSWLSSRLAKMTNIASIIPVEYRPGSIANTWIYVIRCDFSGTATAAWKTFTANSALSILASATDTAITVSATTASYDPLCSGSACTDTSPYPTRQKFVDCTGSTDGVCATSYGTVTDGTPEPSNGDGKKKKSKTGLIVGLVVGLTLGLALIVLLVFLFIRYRKKNSGSDDYYQEKPAKPSTRKSKGSVSQHTNANDPFPFQLEDEPAPVAPKAPKAPKAPQQSSPNAAPVAPKAPKAPKPKNRESTELATTTTHHKSSATRRPQDDGALPHPWKQCTDHLNNVYYINMHTMESSFDRPTH